jgi:hypothetical protein
MRKLIAEAREEITIFFSHPAVLNGLKESLLEAKRKRRVKLKIALTPDVIATADCSNLGEMRVLCCSANRSPDSLGMLITDTSTLLTVSDWFEEVAMLTQDQNLIRVCSNYFDSPACCTSFTNVTR